MSVLSPCHRPAFVVAALLAAILVLFNAPAALAHASLAASEPVDGAVVPVAPSAYVLTFSEPVAPLALKIVRPDGTSAPLDAFELKGNRLEIAAPEGRGRGTHVLSWRVVSADGHPIGGSVVFSIGEASAHAPMVEDDVDSVVRAGLWLSKIALYAGLLLGVGGAFALGVLMPGLRARRGPAVAALLIGVVGAVASAGFQGLDALGADPARIWDPAIWQAGLGTSYGGTVFVALASFVLAGLALASAGRLAAASATAALAAGALSLALSGHASAAAPQWLMRPAVFLHAAAVAVWIGALIPLWLALKRDDPAAGDALRRFSRVIPVGVAVLVVAGLVLTIVQVETPRALFDTAYGRVFLVKLALLVALFLLAAVNRWSLTGPAMAGEPAVSRRLARSIAVETVIALLVFGTVAAWRFTPPPRVIAAEAEKPAAIHIHGAKAMVDLSIEPGRAGPVTIAAAFLDGDFGSIVPKGVTIVFSNPDVGIEPFKRPLLRGSDGVWRAEGVTIPLPGLWRVRLDVLITDFDMARLESEVRIRP